MLRKNSQHCLRFMSLDNSLIIVFVNLAAKPVHDFFHEIANKLF